MTNRAILWIILLIVVIIALIALVRTGMLKF